MLFLVVSLLFVFVCFVVVVCLVML